MKISHRIAFFVFILFWNQAAAQITQVHYRVSDDQCYRSEGAIIVDSVSGGTEPFTYLLADSISSTDGSFIDLLAGSFELTVTDSSGSNFKEQIEITSTDSSLVEFKVLPITGLEDGFIQIVDLISGPNPAYFTVNGIDTFQTEYRVPVEDDYLVRVHAENGCVSQEKLSVKMASPRTENFFSPNNDGINDTWTLANLDFYPNNKVIVFNRFGQRVFGTERYQNDWGGKQLGQDLAEGTYYFVFFYDFNDDAKGTERGFVEIIR